MGLISTGNRKTEIFLDNGHRVGYTDYMNVKQAIAEFDAEIAQAEAALAAQRVRLETLRTMRARLANGSAQVSHGRSDDAVRGGLGPSKAVTQHLRNNPGHDVEAVIAALSGRIRSKSADQARLIRNTVANMLRNEMLWKNEQGELFVSESGPTGLPVGPVGVRVG